MRTQAAPQASAIALALGMAAAPASAETLKWAFQGDVATLDPYAHTESFTSNFLHHIYEPLVRRDRELAFEPAILGAGRAHRVAVHAARRRDVPQRQPVHRR